MQANTILVPVDFSSAQDKALALATSLARDCKAELVIVHVTEPAKAYMAGAAYYGVPDPQNEDLAKMLQEVVPPAPEVEYEQRSLSGAPADAIVECANEIGADLIVMGTHGRTGLSRVLMGSVAEVVVRRAPCPVVTVKDNAKVSAEIEESV